MKVRHAYRCTPSFGQVYVPKDRWLEYSDEEEIFFDWSSEEKQEKLVHAGKEFHYVGSFFGEFYYTNTRQSESEYKKKMDRILPCYPSNPPRQAYDPSPIFGSMRPFNK